MNDLATVFILALLPAIGNFGGGVIAELFRPSARVLNLALHAAAGIVIAIVAVEIMPEALTAASTGVIAGAFALGGIAYIVIESVTENSREDPDGGSRGGGTWMIYVAVAVDLFSDGLMIGAGSAVSTQLALALALGQVLADVPEGFAAIANLRDKGVRRGRRILLSASFAAPVLIGAGISYFLLRGRGEELKMGMLVFTAGLLTVAAVEDMMSEAHAAAEDKHGSVLAFVGGFVLFTLVTAGLSG